MRGGGTVGEPVPVPDERIDSVGFCGGDFLCHDIGFGFILISPEGDFRLLMSGETWRGVLRDAPFGPSFSVESFDARVAVPVREVVSRNKRFPFHDESSFLSAFQFVSENRFGERKVVKIQNVFSVFFRHRKRADALASAVQRISFPFAFEIQRDFCDSVLRKEGRLAPVLQTVAVFRRELHSGRLGVGEMNQSETPGVVQRFGIHGKQSENSEVVFVFDGEIFAVEFPDGSGSQHFAAGRGDAEGFPFADQFKLTAGRGETSVFRIVASLRKQTGFEQIGDQIFFCRERFL